MTCAVCPATHDIRAVELLNGSTMDLCGRCRVVHDALVSAVPMTAEERDNGRAPDEYLRDAQLLVKSTNN